jgi:predicted glycosyltransferase
MGSYTQSAKLFGIRNVIFTDSEFQHFNHRIAHPFADEIYTPECFYKELGTKQVRYKGIHELAFLHPGRFIADVRILQKYPGLHPGEFVLIRLSAWNTLHDLKHSGIGSGFSEFLDAASRRYDIVISGEENQVPVALREYVRDIAPEDFHQLLGHAAFVLSEGASTAAEAACLGIPVVYINSTQPRGYLKMLENDYNLVRGFQKAESGIPVATEWIQSLDQVNDSGLKVRKKQMVSEHIEVTEYVVEMLEGGSE